MGSCQNKSGIVIKSNRRDILEKNQINEKHLTFFVKMFDMAKSLDMHNRL